MNYLKRILYFYLHQPVGQFFFCPDSYLDIFPGVSHLVNFSIPPDFFFNQHLLRRPQKPLFISSLLFPAQVKQNITPSGFFLLLHLIGHSCRFCPFSSGIFKHMGLIEIHLIYKIPGSFKFLFGFPRKSHDHIRGQGRIPEIFPQELAFLIILLCRIPPVHPLQGLRTATLQRQMEMRAHFGKPGDRFSKLFRYDPGFQ